MIAVIFEVVPHAAGREHYLALAAALKQELEGLDGFIAIERFQSLSQPDKLLSLSFWRDEQAVAGWRRLESHRRAQALGRDSLFADYRLRVAGVLRDYGLHQRQQAPEDSRQAHEARHSGPQR
ncbi:antibiotic biosynthesis monooxygenase [Pseudomonas sp. NFXW11]|uniref:antibiotic biosynthesis monooxygenase family protein n=1 Tax=Pseudomonas sp. NFXW11 TaxID=2819531 RepID=UPI003CE8563D